MWRKTFQVALCWLTLSGIPAATEKSVNKAIVKDNVSAESASRLYRNVPLGVYASGAPYAAYSFHLPAFIAAPKQAASRIIPVKEQLALQSFLRDSYGNKFVETPQSTPYKNAFSQQFLPLQELPAHLTQPLVAAPQTKQSTPHYFVGSPYRLSGFQVVQTPANSFGGFSQPFVFAQNFRRIAPSQSAPTNSQANPTNFQSTSTNYQVNPNHFQGTPTKFQTNPTNFQTTHTNFQATPTNFQSTPTYAQGASTNAQSAPTHTQAIAVQQRPSTNQAVYSNSQSEYHEIPQNEVKYQRLENQPQSYRNQPESQHREPADSNEESQEEKTQVDPTSGKTTLTAVVNGKKTVITLDTKPPVPLLDLSLLEPLTFDNPLVPQIQHYLPKITGATYHKLPNFDANEQKQHKKDIHKSKSSPKKTPKQSPVQSDNQHKPRPVKPTITVKGVPNKTPEFSYEINSPNLKETYKEQSISYDKSTESDPVNYTYDEKTQSEPITYTYHTTEQKQPVHYNFVHNSKEPLHVKQVNYQGHGQGPKQLIYTFKPLEQKKEHRHVESSRPGPAANEGSSDESPAYLQNYHSNQAQPKKQRPTYYLRPMVPNMYHVRQHKSNNFAHRSNKEMHLVPNEEVHYDRGQGSPHDSSQQVEGPVQHVEAEYHSPQEYEEDISISSTPASGNEFVKQIQSYQNPHPSPLSSLDEYQKFVEQQTRKGSTSDQPHSSSAPIVHEKAKRIIIQEETPEEMHSHDEQIKAEMIDQEDNNEEEFEKAYKNAAFGFAAFDKQAEDIEKDLYSPNNYGYPHDHDKFDVEKNPFQEYQAEGDSFPKSSRAEYKDVREGTKEDYYLDYSINKPESIADRYKSQANYFKLYKSHKPEKYFGEDKRKKSAKYSVVPSFEFGPKEQQGYFAQYKAEPVQYEYNYDKASRDRDSSAHASRPYQRLRSKTNFVEPQFQYGFEPIGLPKLLDSELAAMASSNSPESEKPGTRKKLYHENWYIKKTSTRDGEPS